MFCWLQQLQRQSRSCCSLPSSDLMRMCLGMYRLKPGTDFVAMEAASRRRAVCRCSYTALVAVGWPKFKSWRLHDKVGLGSFILFFSNDDRNATTCETMVTSSSDHCSADAGVRTNKRCSEAESRRSSKRGVIQFEANRERSSACGHSTDPGEHDASRRARSTGSEVVYKFNMLYSAAVIIHTADAYYQGC